jgi:hypothetical protein
MLIPNPVEIHPSVGNWQRDSTPGHSLYLVPVGVTRLELILSRKPQHVSTNSSISVSLSQHISRSQYLTDTWLAVNDSAAMMFDIQPARSPFNPMMTTVQISIQDAAAFHAALAIYAFVWASTQGSGLQSEMTYHKVKCVRIISSRLNGLDPPSEGTIYAVLLLWGIEVRTYKSYKPLIAD